MTREVDWCIGVDTSDLTAEEHKELSDLHFRVYTDLPVSSEDYERMLELERKTS